MALPALHAQEDPIGLAGGMNLYGYGNGDPLNNADPFGLKVDISRLATAQQRRIRALRKLSPTFRDWYDAIDALPASEHTLTVQNATGRFIAQVQAAGDGLIFPKVGKDQAMLLSTDANWASDMEFEAVVAHEFAHAAAGLNGGTPAGCFDPSAGRPAEDCAAREQNYVHIELPGYRKRRSYRQLTPEVDTRS